MTRRTRAAAAIREAMSRIVDLDEGELDQDLGRAYLTLKAIADSLDQRKRPRS
jgi:hypothetical protein